MLHPNVQCGPWQGPRRRNPTGLCNSKNGIPATMQSSQSDTNCCWWEAMLGSLIKQGASDKNQITTPLALGKTELTGCNEGLLCLCTELAVAAARLLACLCNYCFYNKAAVPAGKESQRLRLPSH